MNEIARQLRFQACRSKCSADNGNYLCAVTIDEAEAAADVIEKLEESVSILRAAVVLFRPDYDDQHNDLAHRYFGGTGDLNDIAQLALERTA